MLRRTAARAGQQRKAACREARALGQALVPRPSRAAAFACCPGTCCAPMAVRLSHESGRPYRARAFLSRARRAASDASRAACPCNGPCCEAVAGLPYSGRAILLRPSRTRPCPAPLRPTAMAPSREPCAGLPYRGWTILLSASHVSHRQCVRQRHGMARARQHWPWLPSESASSRPCSRSTVP